MAGFAPQWGCEGMFTWQSGMMLVVEAAGGREVDFVEGGTRRVRGVLAGVGRRDGNERRVDGETWSHQCGGKSEGRRERRGRRRILSWTRRDCATGR